MTLNTYTIASGRISILQGACSASCGSGTPHENRMVFDKFRLKLFAAAARRREGNDGPPRRLGFAKILQLSEQVRPRRRTHDNSKRY
jgi:hypothetical protein